MSKQSNKVKNMHSTKPKKNPGILSGVPKFAHFSHLHVKSSLAVAIIFPWLLVGIITGLVIVHNHNRPKLPMLATSNDGITLEVEKVTYDIRGKYPYTPPSGWRFIIAHVEITNNSKYLFNFAPVVQAFIKADKGKNTYSMAPDELNNPIMAGPINVGKSVEGDISFLVPFSASDPNLVFYAGVKDQVPPLIYKLPL